MESKVQSIENHSGHPEKVLFGSSQPFSEIPCCEHYCGNEKFTYKSFSLQAELGTVFDITCDCEDGAKVGEERKHANLVADLVNHADNLAKRTGVRIHDPAHSDCKTDIDILVGIAGNNLAYLTIPKVDSYDQGIEIVNYINTQCIAAGIGLIPIHIIIESQSALRDLKKIVKIPGIEALDFGLLDFISDHQGIITEKHMQSPNQFDHHLINRGKAKLVAATAEMGLTATHNPCTSFRDLDRCLEDATIARQRFGFSRMYSIYPKQIPFIVEAMQPPHQAILRACEILIKAQKHDWGPISHGNEMHDRASYRLFWRLLKRAQVTGANLPVDVQNAFFRDEPLIDWQSIKEK